jgi:hypothetical protein
MKARGEVALHLRPKGFLLVIRSNYNNYYKKDISSNSVTGMTAIDNSPYLVIGTSDKTENLILLQNNLNGAKNHEPEAVADNFLKV